MHNAAIWTPLLILICTAMLELAHTKEYSYRDDFKLENQTYNDTWVTNIEMSKNYKHCFDVMDIRTQKKTPGIPTRCWKATWVDNELEFRCTVEASSKKGWLNITIGGDEIKQCLFEKNIKVKNCAVKRKELQYDNNKMFSCRQKCQKNNDDCDLILDAFILRDMGVPEKPEFRQHSGSVLICSINKTRSDSFLEIVSLKNNQTKASKMIKDLGNSELTFNNITQEDRGQPFKCSHKYSSGKTNDSNIIFVQEHSTSPYKTILYAVIVVVAFSSLCLVAYILCKCCNERKSVYRPDESSVSDFPFVTPRTPTLKFQRQQSAEYAVPIPKRQRKENNQYTKRSKCAEPAYSDPLDFELDQPYMEIGSALYASIKGSSLYAEVGSTEPPYVNGEACRNNQAFDDEGSVKYSSLLLKDTRTYANTSRIYANAGAMNISQNTTEGPHELIYSTVKPAKPKPAPKPRKKTNETSGYVTMR